MSEYMRVHIGINSILDAEAEERGTNVYRTVYCNLRTVPGKSKDTWSIAWNRRTDRVTVWF